MVTWKRLHTNSVNTQKQKTTEVCIPLTHLFSLLTTLPRSRCGGARCRCKIPAAPRPSPSPSCVGCRDPPLYRSPFPPSCSAQGQARRRWGQRGGAGPCPGVFGVPGAMDVAAAGFGRLLPGLRDRVRSAAFLGERRGPAGCPHGAPLSQL